MPAKKFDPKAKAKRQKIIAAGGAVLLLALLAIQVPRTMKMLNAQATVAEPPVEIGAPIGSSDPSILPTPGTAAAGGAAAASGGGTLADSDPAPAADRGQLVAFGRFASKDPFQQQIDVREQARAAAAGSNAPTVSGNADSGTTTATTPPSTNAAAPPGSGMTSPTGGQAPGPVRGALISVNGVQEPVTVGATFPKDEPVFKLVALTRTAAKIAIAGGALASGEATTTLPKGKAVMLVNTADGTRYELKLVAVG